MNPPTTPAPEPYQSLIDSAEAWHTAGQYKEAVILAQTGLEIFTEKVLAQLYRRRQVEYLQGSFESLLINYNLGNSKVSGLYVALSDDPIKQQPFWSALTEHVELRNNLVHDGADASQDQSRRSLDAVKAVIGHIRQANNL